MASGTLTVSKPRLLEKPRRYGAGLWLQVRDAQHGSWLFRYPIAGKSRHTNGPNC
jgi:hypothetical protein